MSDVDKTLSFLESFSKTQADRANTSFSRLSKSGGNVKDLGFKFDPKKPNFEKPPAIGDLLNDYEKQDVNVLLLDGAAEKWIAKYFPNLTECLSSEPEAWACSILHGTKPFGMNKEAFEAAWHEGRDRASRQANSERAQVRALYSNSGFSLPQGAQVYAETAVEHRASAAIAELNREQIQREEEIKLRLIELAATTATNIKTSMMTMLASFFGKIVDLSKTDPGADKMRAKAQAYSAFMYGLSAYYNAELGFEKLRLDAASTDAEMKATTEKLKAETAKGVDSRNAAIGTMARGFVEAAGMAANAASSLQAELFSGQI